MCGIAGLWRRDQQRFSAEALEPALSRLRHRGPDDEGFLVADTASRSVTLLGGDDSPKDLPLPSWRTAIESKGDVLLGHRRLSILDLSPRGHQPMPLDKDQCWIVFNGEIYNYIELREELKALGHIFHSGSDTEVILHAWQAWGPECLNRFNGDWAFALLDLRKEGEPELFVARDRWGIKPLFYVDTPDAFWFASEAKALIGQAILFEPREHAVIRFLTSGELPQGHGSDTFFEGIQQVPPGEAIRITSQGLERIRWYDLREATSRLFKVDEATAVAEMAEQVTSAVNIRLRADVPVGSCLSGGVDSSSIVGTMRQLFDKKGAGELHTFSAVYRERGTFDESQWITQVVDHSKSKPHYTYPDEMSLAEDFDKMVWHQDEPFQTASIFAQWCVMREARAQGVVVLLDGQAADELLAGYQPGTYQEHFLETFGKKQISKLVKDWMQRKSATQLPFNLLWNELSHIFVHGATGVLKLERDTIQPRARLESLAFSDELIDQLAPKAHTDEDTLRAKIAEDYEKLAKLKAKRNSKKKSEELEARLAKKKREIASNRYRLARLTKSGLRHWYENVTQSFKVVWNRFNGLPMHNLRQHLLTQTTTTSLAHLLRFEDRNSMAFSVEARVPFTDFQLIEWAFKRANDHKIKYGWTKWILRKAMLGRAPETILWRRDKIGFETPDVKMAQRLMDQNRRHPADSAFLLRFLSEKRIRETCARVIDGTAGRDEGRLVWRWLVLDSWQRQFEQMSQESIKTGPVPAPATECRLLSTISPVTLMSKPKLKHHICIVSFSPIARDARVLRQVKCLAPYYRLTVVGFGDSDPFDHAIYPEVRWIGIDRSFTIANPAAQKRDFFLGKFFPDYYVDYLKHFPFWRYAWHIVQSAKFKVVLCNDVDALPLGAAAVKANPECRLILDMHEYATREYEEDGGEEWFKVRKPLVTGLLKRFAPIAKATMTVSDAFVPLFNKEFGMKKAVVVYNAPLPVPLPERTLSAGDKVHLIHHGGAAPQREMERMIKAMAFTDDRFILHFMLSGGDDEYYKKLESEAAKLPQGKVIFEPAVMPNEIVAKIAQYDIGIYILPPVNFNCIQAMPNKFFDFIVAGLAIAIAPSVAMAQKVREHGIGWVADDFTPEAMAKMLNALTIEEIEVKRKASRELAKKLNGETEMAKVLEVVSKFAKIEE